MLGEGTAARKSRPSRSLATATARLTRGPESNPPELRIPGEYMANQLSPKEKIGAIDAGTERGNC